LDNSPLSDTSFVNTFFDLCFLTHLTVSFTEHKF
jgi:hypothetical protein